MTSPTSDIAIIGTGPAGLVTALAVAQKGFDVALIGRRPTPDPERPDTRTIALFEGALGLLKNLDAWNAVAKDSNPLRAIRIIDDTGNLFRAPEILFDARDIDRQAFGQNVPNAHLIDVLFELALGDANISFVETEGVIAVDTGGGGHGDGGGGDAGEHVSISLKDGSSHLTKLVAAADGRNSICREAASIDVKRWSYPQTATVCNFEHSLPHDDISTEFHRKAGPFTTVPMGHVGHVGHVGEAGSDTGTVTSSGAPSHHMSSLVWVETPEEANRLKALNDAGYIVEMEKRLQGFWETSNQSVRVRLFPCRA